MELTVQNDYFRYYRPKLLLFIIIALSACYGAVLPCLANLINSSLPEPYISFPSVTVLITLTLWLLNKCGLITAPIKYLFWVQNIAGRYEGNITYKHFETGKEEEKNCFVEIEQNASKIVVNTYFDFIDSRDPEKTKSTSIITSIIADDDFDNQKLVFTYQNEGNPVKGMQPSNGTNVLSIIKRDDDLFLEGIYYTDREPQTKGQMKVKLISQKLQRSF